MCGSETSRSASSISVDRRRFLAASLAAAAQLGCSEEGVVDAEVVVYADPDSSETLAKLGDELR